MNIINTIYLKAILIYIFHQWGDYMCSVFEEEIEMKDRDAAQTTGDSYSRSLTTINLNKSL